MSDIKLELTIDGNTWTLMTGDKILVSSGATDKAFILRTIQDIKNTQDKHDV